MAEYGSDAYVEKALIELIDDLGVKDEIDLTSLESQFYEKDIHPGVQAIAKQLGLPVFINLEFGEKNIQSSDLARTDAKGRGIEGVIAQVRIPSYLPFYGSSELRDYPIKVFIGHDYRDQVATLIAILIHELSHILLHSMRARYREDEIHTDLVGPILGMASAVEKGRKIIKTEYSGDLIHTQTTTYGYLSDDQFDRAKKMISQILGQKKREDEVAAADLSELERLQMIARQLGKQFTKALDKIDSFPRKQISDSDAIRLISFHQPGYLDDLRKILKDSQDHIESSSSFIKFNRHYTKNRATDFVQIREKTTATAASLLSINAEMKNNVEILKKGTKFRVRYLG